MMCTAVHPTTSASVDNHGLSAWYLWQLDTFFAENGVELGAKTLYLT